MLVRLKKKIGSCSTQPPNSLGNKTKKFFRIPQLKKKSPLGLILRQTPKKKANVTRSRIIKSSSLISKVENAIKKTKKKEKEKELSHKGN